MRRGEPHGVGWAPGNGHQGMGPRGWALCRGLAEGKRVAPRLVGPRGWIGGPQGWIREAGPGEGVRGWAPGEWGLRVSTLEGEPWGGIPEAHFL